MFDIGFSEVLLIFVIALVVLGPEKLPRAASQVGRWVGRARAMARQFKEQLEEEVNLENVRKAHKEAAAKEEAASKDAASGGGTAAGAGAASAGVAGAAAGRRDRRRTASRRASAGRSAVERCFVGGEHRGTRLRLLRPRSLWTSAQTLSPTLTRRTSTAQIRSRRTERRRRSRSRPRRTRRRYQPRRARLQNPGRPRPSASSPSAPLTAEAGISSDNAHRTDSTEAYAPATKVTPTLPASEPLREPVPATTTQSDNHGHS